LRQDDSLATAVGGFWQQRQPPHLNEGGQPAVEVCHAAEVAVPNDVGYKNLSLLKLGSCDVFQNVLGGWLKRIKSRRFFDSRDDILDAEQEILQFGI